MNVQSNKYTVIYASIMVVAVAAVLTLVSVGLQPMQQKNIDNEKKQNILASVNVEANLDNAGDLYTKYITGSFVIDGTGNKIDGDAFTIDMKEVAKNAKDLRKLKEDGKTAEAENLKKQMKLPVFEFNKDGQKALVIPVRGTGLWDAIWGYVAVEDDCNTIYGVSFDHAGETPGLGAEITTPGFQEQFKGKKLFANGDFHGLTVYNHGTGAANDKEFGIDGISGGTITSRCVGEMIFDCFSGYEKFLKSAGGKTAYNNVKISE